MGGGRKKALKTWFLSAESPKSRKSTGSTGEGCERLSGWALEQSSPEFTSHICYFVVVEMWASSLSLTPIK